MDNIKYGSRLQSENRSDIFQSHSTLRMHSTHFYNVFIRSLRARMGFARHRVIASFVLASSIGVDKVSRVCADIKMRRINAVFIIAMVASHMPFWYFNSGKNQRNPRSCNKSIAKPENAATAGVCRPMPRPTFICSFTFKLFVESYRRINAHKFFPCHMAIIPLLGKE